MKANFLTGSGGGRFRDDSGAVGFLCTLSLFLWSSLVAQSVESACSVGDLASIAGSGRSPGEGTTRCSILA